MKGSKERVNSRTAKVYPVTLIVFIRNMLAVANLKLFGP